jgi:hypothetical protein
VTQDEDLSQFVREHIASVWALELLLLLRSRRERCWNAADLVREMRSSPKVVDENLSRLQRFGLAVLGEKGWRFAPANAWLEVISNRLADAYRERPVSIIGMISHPDPVQSLAEAFKIKGDET